MDFRQPIFQFFSVSILGMLEGVKRPISQTASAGLRFQSLVCWRVLKVAGVELGIQPSQVSILGMLEGVKSTSTMVLVSCVVSILGMLEGC